MRYMKSIRNIFRRKPKQEPMPLRIEGIGPAPMTPEPDDAELAAMAYLEHLISPPEVGGARGGLRSALPLGSSKNKRTAKPNTAAYYHDLADKVKQGRAMEARLALRYVAYCEEMLQEAPAPDILSTLHHGLFRHQTAVDREGGQLKRRWQHCLATITVRQMM